MANDPLIHGPRLRLSWSVVGLLLLASAGCGKIPTWGELTGQAKPEAAPVVQPIVSPVVAPPVQNIPQLPPPPDPAVVLQEFRALKPGQVNDAELAKLGELSEGLDQITEIDAHGGQVTKAGLAVLEKLPNLKFINLDGTPIGDAGAELLAKAPALESVTLNGSNITDAGIAALGPLTNLRELRIARAQLTQAGFAEIARHKTIERLLLDATPLNDVSFQMLCSLENLNYLEVRDTQVTDLGLMGLAKLDRLESLEVSGCGGVHGEAFFKLAKSKALENLRHLSLTACPLNERGARGINNMKQLEYLNIAQTGAADVHIAFMIRGMAKLKHLVMGSNSSVTNEVLKAVGQLKQLEVLILENQPGISDVGLSYLKGLKELKYVSVGNTSISPNGLQALKQFCPELDLNAGAPPMNPFRPRKPGEALAETPQPRTVTPGTGKPSGFIAPTRKASGFIPPE